MTPIVNWNHAALDLRLLRVYHMWASKLSKRLETFSYAIETTTKKAVGVSERPESRFILLILSVVMDKKNIPYSHVTFNNHSERSN